MKSREICRFYLDFTGLNLELIEVELNKRVTKVFVVVGFRTYLLNGGKYKKTNLFLFTFRPRIFPSSGMRTANEVEVL